MLIEKEREEVGQLLTINDLDWEVRAPAVSSRGVMKCRLVILLSSRSGLCPALR